MPACWSPRGRTITRLFWRSHTVELLFDMRALATAGTVSPPSVLVLLSALGFYFDTLASRLVLFPFTIKAPAPFPQGDPFIWFWPNQSIHSQPILWLGVSGDRLCCTLCFGGVLLKARIFLCSNFLPTKVEKSGDPRRGLSGFLFMFPPIFILRKGRSPAYFPVNFAISSCHLSVSNCPRILTFSYDTIANHQANSKAPKSLEAKQ